MNKKFAIIPIIAVLLGGGAVATAQVGQGDPPPEEPPEPTVVPPTVLEDWCGFMAMAFGPDAGVASVEAAFTVALGSATVTPETAYVALLEGIPDEIEPQFAVVRVAGQNLVDGAPVPNPTAVLAAAAQVDAFMASSCAG